MHVVLSQSTQEAVAAVVTKLLDRVSSHPNLVIGLATGKTMEPVYELWVKEARSRKIDHEKCFFFMLDEYLDIDVHHPSSFRSYIYKRLIKPLGLRESQFAFPPIHLAEKAGEHYEQLIQEAGGIDLQLLGIGKNGHIGFNEPGSTKSSLTRIVDLTTQTIEANRPQFEGNFNPTRALSMGIATIYSARELIMLATGNSKSSVVKYLFNHHDDETCPATYLKSHAHFTLVLDPAAGSNISLKI
jgi:glucosamine-6-phosphate deaminase